jgi:hypothetical protein
MKALYLYFTGSTAPGRGPSPASGVMRSAAVPPAFDEGPLVPIQPGAFSRWKANRDRVIAENAAGLRSGGSGDAAGRHPVRIQRPAAGRY